MLTGVHSNAMRLLITERSLKKEAAEDTSLAAFFLSHRYMKDAAERYGICSFNGQCGLDFASIHTLLGRVMVVICVS